MTTYIKFLPSNIVAPRFSATFDDDQYTIIITWNLSSQRYFINVYGSNGNWLCTVPLIESSVGAFISKMNYNKTTRTMEVTVQNPRWHQLGEVSHVTIEDCQPNTINGVYEGLVISPYVFAIPMPTDPGQITVLGSASRLINMIAGYFQNSSLVYRNTMFEVRP